MPPEPSLAGRGALITGGAGAIGSGMAQAFAEAGARVVLADISDAALAGASAELAKVGIEVGTIAMDVSKPDMWSRAMKSIEEAHGPIDILCNNAGLTSSRKPIEEVSLDDWHQVMDVNINALFYALRAFLPRIKARGRGGHVVNSASLSGFFTSALRSEYCTTKFAMVGLSECLRAELEPFGIGVSILAPGMVRSDIVANSARLRPSTRSGPVRDDDMLAKGIAQGMDPRCVGRMVVQGILENRLYIFTHPEYAERVAGRLHAVQSAFGESAQPGYVDDLGLLERALARK